MKKSLLVLLAFFAIGLCSQFASAQSATRINFARGTHEKVVTGRLAGFKSKRVFIIRVGAGQTLTTQSTGKNFITIDIQAPKGSTYAPDLGADCHANHEVTPTVAGDYRITVTECQKADPWKGTFKLKVTAR